jgi:hypothetical protein
VNQNRVPFRAHKAAVPRRAAPSPTARQLESISAGSCSLLLPCSRAPCQGPGAPTATTLSTACSPWPRPHLAHWFPHAPTVPCSLARVREVPVRGTRPNRQDSAPGAAPRGARSSGPGSARPGAGSLLLAAPARAPAAAREEGGVAGNSRQLQLRAPSSRRSRASARRRRRRRVRARRSQPAPAPASEHAQCRRGRAERPGPGQRAAAWGRWGPPPARGCRAQGTSGGRVGARALSAGPRRNRSVCARQCEFQGSWKFAD